MSLFSCCPKKPKKSLDYVIKWVEDTDKTIKDLSDTVQELNKWKEDISEETLRPIFDEYAETYPWDNVPAFNAKADKVEDAVAGNLASLDSEGNLLDSGKKPSDFVPNVSGATEGNLPQFDAEGNIQDSGNKAEDFALAGHSHSAIIDASTESSISIDEGVITLTIEGEGSGGKTQINADNIGNLHRALATPSSIPENDATKLITSKAVYDALPRKMDNLRSIRITYDRVEDEFVVSESDKAVLVTFKDSASADTFVPVLVSLYEGDTKDSDVFGLAKWSEEQQPHFMDINILVVIGKYYFSAKGMYQDIEDIQFSRWTRTVQGQSFFS